MSSINQRLTSSTLIGTIRLFGTQDTANNPDCTPVNSPDGSLNDMPKCQSCYPDWDSWSVGRAEQWLPLLHCAGRFPPSYGIIVV